MVGRESLYHYNHLLDSVPRTSSALPFMGASGMRAKQACFRVLEILCSDLRTLLRKIRVVDDHPYQCIR